MPASTACTLPNGRTVHSAVVRPFFVRANSGADRRFGSLESARRYARGASISGSIFFDYAPGCGHFLERVG